MADQKFLAADAILDMTEGNQSTNQSGAWVKGDVKAGGDVNMNTNFNSIVPELGFPHQITHSNRFVVSRKDSLDAKQKCDKTLFDGKIIRPEIQKEPQLRQSLRCK